MRKQRLLTGIAGILMAFLFTGCNTSSVEKWVDEVVEDINGQIPDNTLLPVESVSEEKYVYGQLTEEEQLVYDEMLDAILNHREEVAVATLDKDVLAKMYEAIMADYGGLFWVDGYSYTEYSRAGVLTGLKFAPKYTMDEAARQETQAAIDEKVDVLLGGISSEDSDYQKARFIFDTLVRTVNYDLNAENNQNIISVFLEGRTVCQGYACATKYLMDLLDIPCTIVTGTANGEPHAWNLIELDGAYYYMDTTWGNPTSNSPDDFGDVAEVVDYCFFTATTEELFQTHSPNVNFSLPECNCLDDSYFVQENCYFKDWYPEDIGALFTELDSHPVQMKFEDEAVYGQAQQFFIEEGHIGDYYTGDSSLFYMKNETMRVLTFLKK